VQRAVTSPQPPPVELVFRHLGPALYAQALSILKDASAAEDVVQDAFVRVWRRRHRLVQQEKLGGYLATAVRNLAFDHLRRGRRAAESQVLIAVSEAKSEPEVPDTERLDAALAALPPEQREVVVLRVHLELSFPEIAERTQSPLGTVHSRYRYAMTRLRETLRPQAAGGESHD